MGTGREGKSELGLFQILRRQRSDCDETVKQVAAWEIRCGVGLASIVGPRQARPGPTLTGCCFVCWSSPLWPSLALSGPQTWYCYAVRWVVTLQHSEHSEHSGHSGQNTTILDWIIQLPRSDGASLVPLIQHLIYHLSCEGLHFSVSPPRMTGKNW